MSEDNKWSAFFKDAVQQSLGEMPLLLPDTAKMIIINSVLYLGGLVTAQNPANRPLFEYMNNRQIFRREDGALVQQQLMHQGQIWYGIPVDVSEKGDEYSLAAIVPVVEATSKDEVAKILQERNIESAASRQAALKIASEFSQRQARSA